LDKKVDKLKLDIDDQLREIKNDLKKLDEIKGTP
jgi:hypothetical protein